jgi:hypothetical protein
MALAPPLMLAYVDRFQLVDAGINVGAAVYLNGLDAGRRFQTNCTSSCE